MSYKIMVHETKNNINFCWMNKSNILRSVGKSNTKIPHWSWWSFFLTLETKFGDETPEMWDKFTYKNEVMRCYVTPEEDGEFRITLKELPEHIFGRKYKTFKNKTLFECYEEAYAYVTAKLAEENNLQQLIHENEQLKKELALVTAKYEDALQIIEDIADKESKKAANERQSTLTGEYLDDGLEYFYDWETKSFRKVIRFDEFNQPVLAPKGFPFDDATGIRIIKLYHNKGLTPQQIVSHMGLRGLNKDPKKTVENFLHAYNKGLLTRTIKFCCNNPYNDIDEDPESLVKE